MPTVSIEQHYNGGLGVVPVGVAPAAGLNITQVTPTGTAASTILDNETTYVSVFSEDVDVRFDIGTSVTASSASRLLMAGTGASYAIEPGAIMTVSIILA